MVAAYVHNAASPELGKIGVLVALKSTADEDKLAALAKQIAMHVAAASAAGADAGASVARMWSSANAMSMAELARQSGKPDNVIEKMMEGRMRKFYEETVLLSQTFVIDGETQVGKVIEKAAKEFGAPGRRSKALSASRWARASRRSTAISPTKSHRWRASNRGR